MSNKIELTNLEQFIEALKPELRVGGGATLDELYNLAIVVQADLLNVDKHLNGLLNRVFELEIATKQGADNERS